MRTTVHPLVAMALAIMIVASACSTIARDVAPSATPGALGAPEATGLTRYIGHTDGQGVRLRTECRDGAATEGSLAEQFEVQVDSVGSGACAGWTRVHSGSIVTWVRNAYLVDSLAAARSAPPPVTGAAAVASGGMPSVTSGGVVNAPPAFAFTATGGARVTLAEIDGAATLWGGPNQLVYLGLLAGAPLPDSVCNPSGRFGSASSATSIRNRGGEYGSPTSERSPYHAAAETPPVIKVHNATVAVLTVAPGARGVVHPDGLLAALCR